MESQKLVSSGVKGFSSLVGLQMSSRLLTFVLNLFLARQLEPSVFGVAAVEMQLLVTTSLFLSREGVRRACQRSTVGLRGETLDDTRVVVQMAWISVFASSLVIPCVGYIFLSQGSKSEHFAISVWLHGLGAFLEMLGEPAYVLAQNRLLFQIRVAVEGGALTLKCLLTYFCVVFCNMQLLAFAIAQVAYGLALAVGYTVYTLRRSPLGSERSKRGALDELLPGWQLRFQGTLGRLAVNFSVQSLEKYVLTEGEKVALLFFVSLPSSDVGLFGLVSNLGSLVVRFFFQPLEETAFAVFTKLLRPKTGTSDITEEVVSSAGKLLALLLHLMVLVALIFVSFGPNYSYILLHLLYGSKWSTTAAPTVLAAYCVYVGVIAINGITETWVLSSISPVQLRRWNILLLTFSGAYLCAAVVLARYMGVVGLIWANCVNMSLRIVYSASFISQYFKNQTSSSFRWAAALPPLPIFITAVAVGFGTCASERVFGVPAGSMASQLAHIAFGAVCLLVYLGVCYVCDREFIRELRSFWKSRKSE